MDTKLNEIQEKLDQMNPVDREKVMELDRLAHKLVDLSEQMIANKKAYIRSN